jgi:hypothetical protein
MAMFNETLQQFRKQFRNGSFCLRLQDDLATTIRSNNVPDEAGVYVISGLTTGKAEILYIGMAGTMQNNGQFKDQKLSGRLQAKQSWNGKRYNRADFYRMQMCELNLQQLSFEWFITFDKTYKVLPAGAEGDLIQSYYLDCRKLPRWNLEF